MQDNTGTLTIQTALTRIGRKRLSEGRFNVTKFAVSDDGVNYKVYNTNLPQPDSLITRSPLFSVWKDGASALRSKIPVSGFSNDTLASFVGYRYPLNIIAPFNPNPQASSGQTKPTQSPRLVVTSKSKNVVYDIRGATEARNSIRTEFTIPYTNVPYPNGSGLHYISVTLHDTKYFDLGVTNEYYNSVNEIYTDFTLRNDVPSLTVSNKNLFSLPKTVNLGYDGTIGMDARFVLFYKGNFPFKNVGNANYETIVTLTCEYTGISEDIRVTLTPSNTLNS